MALQVDLPLEVLLVIQKFVEILNQLSLHHFLFLLRLVISNEKYAVDGVSIFVENDTVIELAICVLALVNDALH